MIGPEGKQFCRTRDEPVTVVVSSPVAAREVTCSTA